MQLFVPPGIVDKPTVYCLANWNKLYWSNLYSSAAQCSLVQYSAVQCSEVQCSTVQCSLLHCTAKCNIVSCYSRAVLGSVCSSYHYVLLSSLWNTEELQNSDYTKLYLQNTKYKLKNSYKTGLVHRLQVQTRPDATPPIQQNHSNSWTNNAILMLIEINNCLKMSSQSLFYDWKHHLQLFGPGGTVKIFSQRMNDY